MEAEQQEAARTRAEAALRAEVPQEALEALMRELFRGADTDGSGALSRAVRITYRNAWPVGALTPAACCACTGHFRCDGFQNMRLHLCRPCMRDCALRSAMGCRAVPQECIQLSPPQEFKACLRSETAAGLRLTRQDINTLLTEVDTDGDGLVDYEASWLFALNGDANTRVQQSQSVLFLSTMQ